ncbi:hypothetical protein PT2222_110350 [Paraburkholderia tropica]
MRRPGGAPRFLAFSLAAPFFREVQRTSSRGAISRTWPNHYAASARLREPIDTSIDTTIATFATFGFGPHTVLKQ